MTSLDVTKSASTAEVLADPTRLDWLTEREAAAYTRFAAGSLRNMRCDGRGPKFCKVGGAIRYRRRDLIEWMEHGS